MRLYVESYGQLCNSHGAIMAARYSVDLRRRIVQACERGTQSQREVAEFFNVSLSFVESLLQYYRRSGGELVRPQRRRGRHALLDDACRERLRHWLHEQSDMTLKELVERLHGCTGMTVSEPTMCRVLHQMGMRRKKRLSMPQNGTACAYVWHAADTAGKSQNTRSKG
ncbi:helix-turn-helix domain-containing protein [Noviherbaspirillum autotrophicum]|uniref:helix-turn-helix domain-containing protein n=1 Tax=Noviherbaspirillum autotrophicum TaxID=709839 RepID=UPI000A03918C|nr:helix-turn-helix domain-containing protein [Noviherbaspirillum autotrophicum]